MEKSNAGYYLGITGNRFSTLLERQYVVPTLELPPTESTSSWQDGEYTVEFRIGELCRVWTDNKWIFYRLQNISDSKCEWVEANTCGVIYLTYEEYDAMRKAGTLSQSTIYMIMDGEVLIELRIGELLIGIKGSANNGLPYYFPIVF